MTESLIIPEAESYLGLFILQLPRNYNSNVRASPEILFLLSESPLCPIDMLLRLLQF